MTTITETINPRPAHRSFLRSVGAFVAGALLASMAALGINAASGSSTPARTNTPTVSAGSNAAPTHAGDQLCVPVHGKC